MKTIVLIAGIIIGVVVLAMAIVLFVKRPRKLKVPYFQERWRELQKLCAAKDTWPEAITQADNLLDEALRRLRFSGKSMGERLTKAQRIITDNEGVWYGHKLRAKLETDPNLKLQEANVKQALVGIRQALKDLGAFPNDK